jgi:Tol biopolymer transport system component
MVLIRNTGSVKRQQLKSGTEEEIYASRLGLICCTRWSPDERWVSVAESADERRWQVVLVDSSHPGVAAFTLTGGPATAWRTDSRMIALNRAGAAGEGIAFYGWDLKSKEMRRMTFPPRGTRGDIALAFSPSGTRLAFVREWAARNGDIFLARSDGSEARQLTRFNLAIKSLEWLDERYLAISTEWRHEEGIYAVDIQDPSRLLDVPVATGKYDNLRRAVHVDGVPRLTAALATVNNDLVRYDVSTHQERPVAVSTQSEVHPHINVRGQVVFVSNRSGADNLWVCEADCEKPRQITRYTQHHASMEPRWSPDGFRIAFVRRAGDGLTLTVIDAERGNPQAIATGKDIGAPAWSLDGRELFFRSSVTGRPEIWRVAATGGEPLQVTRMGGAEAFPHPDGRSLYILRGMENSTLVRHWLEDGREEAVTELPPLRAGYWTASGNSLWFWDRATSQWQWNLTQFDPVTRNALRWIPDQPSHAQPGLSVDPITRTVWWSQGVVPEQVDVILLELHPRSWWSSL